MRDSRGFQSLCALRPVFGRSPDRSALSQLPEPSARPTPTSVPRMIETSYDVCRPVMSGNSDSANFPNGRATLALKVLVAVARKAANKSLVEGY